MPHPPSCCLARGGYCDRCRLLVGLDGLRVIAVERDDAGGLAVMAESESDVVVCPDVRGRRPPSWPGRGRYGRRAVGGPAGADCVAQAVPSCSKPVCPTCSFVEQAGPIASPRRLLTVRACLLGTQQIRRGHASVAGVLSRFDGVRNLGVDEHVWHPHVQPSRSRTADVAEGADRYGRPQLR